MKRVIIESPFAGDFNKNINFLGACIHDCIGRGEAPFASHGLYTNFMDDNDPAQRSTGIACGHTWMEVCDYVVVYTDLGISRGMQAGIDYAAKCGKPVVMRSLAQSSADTAQSATT